MALPADPHTSHVHHWTVGDLRVTAVIESTDVFPGAFVRDHLLPEATPAALRAMPWLAPHWADPDGEPRFVSQTFLITTSSQRILVDTCIGNDKPRKNPLFDRLATPFLDRLASAGATPEAIDVVLCTHLHFDHVGWNTRREGARWIPTFPRARYLFSRAEWEHWSARAGHSYVIDDSIRPLLDADLVDLVDLPHTITDEIDLVPTPGHTPGHASVRLRSAGVEALITGDLIHHPCQVAHPEWKNLADTDPELAHATRTAVLDDVERRHVLLFGTHFAPPAAGHLERDLATDRRRLAGREPTR